jgi:hypothetical protein
MLRRVCFIGGLLIAAAYAFSAPPAQAAGDELYPRPRTSCLACHADLKKMRDLGFAELYVGGDQVPAQESDMAYSASSLRTPACVSCHLGNPRDYTLEGAHKGLLGPLVMMSKERVVKKRDQLSRGERKQMKSLAPTGVWDLGLQPKYWDETTKQWKSDPALYFTLWHDHSPQTAAYNPVSAMKTCGYCHINETSSFAFSPMGAGEFKKGERETVTQPQYTNWLAGTGPHSCGIWVGKLAEPDLASFSRENLDLSNRVMSKEITVKMMEVTQRNCNKCHVGCLDCHYSPGKNSPQGPPGKFQRDLMDNVYGDPQKTYGGMHRMLRRPTVQSCMGGARGYACHSGPLERRRGDGYVRGSLAMPPWDKEAKNKFKDVHYQNGLQCIDCHAADFAENGHSALIRDPEPQACAQCHPWEVKVWQKGKHKKVRCEGCHTPVVFGYGWNFWVPGKERGIQTTIDRHSAYQKDAVAPVLLPDPEGMWAPYNCIPHIAANIKPEEFKKSRLARQKGLMVFRSAKNRHGKPLGLRGAEITRAYRSSDAFVLTDFYQSKVNPPNEDWVMTWLSLEKVAHLTSGLTHKPRDCRSCHTPDGGQRAVAQFRWLGSPQAMYEDVHHGSYSIVADQRGLRLEALQAKDQDDAPAKGLADKESAFMSAKADYRIKPVKEQDLIDREKLDEAFRGKEKGAQRIVQAAAIRKKPFAFEASEMLQQARAEAHHGDIKKGLALLDQVLALRKRF